MVLKWFYSLSRRKTFVGGKCALPSALLVLNESRSVMGRLGLETFSREYFSVLVLNVTDSNLVLVTCIETKTVSRRRRTLFVVSHPQRTYFIQTETTNARILQHSINLNVINIYKSHRCLSLFGAAMIHNPALSTWLSLHPHTSSGTNKLSSELGASLSINVYIHNRGGASAI